MNHIALAKRCQLTEPAGAMRVSRLLPCAAALAVHAIVPGIARAQSPAPTATFQPAPPKAIMTQHAKGTFEVTVKPAATADASGADQVKRMTLDKQFTGDLTGTGKGEMLASGSPDGAGAYVAIEQVSGALGGRKGGFVFQHSGTINHGTVQLTITVVPGSGTGELTGLAGTFKIDVVEGKHFYDFEYTLPQ